MVREKIVAASSRRLIILVGEEKLVPQLGTHGKLPVEVVPFALPLCMQRLPRLGCRPVPYREEGRLFLTDNAYHQPGVEAGKKAAASILALQGKVLAAVSTAPQTAEQIASGAGAADAAETVSLLLEHLAANGRARSNGVAAPGQMAFCKPRPHAR